jgi:hypothetical protein
MKRFAALTMILALAAPGAAMAQDAPNALDDTYKSDQRVLGEVGTVDSGSGPSSGTAPTEPAPVAAPVVADSGSLPFTGFDGALIAGGGLLLLAGGFVLRRVARPSL